jgi:glycine/D-amino acid oxidase-like deaminating enzyme
MQVTVLEAAAAPAQGATKASWAWLNSNYKQPQHYKGATYHHAIEIQIVFKAHVSSPKLSCRLGTRAWPINNLNSTPSCC